MNGILNLIKPEEMSSFLAVRICRAIFETKKAGHAGTLDPLATGVLPILIGNACGAANFFLSEKKTYRATFEIGYLTDTEDSTGTVIEKTDAFPDLLKIQEAARGFLGKSSQIPPMYSALKKDGRPLYELARRGETVEREAREITVDEIAVTQGSHPVEFVLEATVSKGTYIRTLITDIARRAGTLATMTALCRTRHGDFLLKDAITLDELKAKKEAGEDLSPLLFDVQRAFSGYDAVTLPAFYARLQKNGAEIYAERVKALREYKEGDRLRVYGDDGVFFALGEMRVFDDGLALKPLKLFL